MNHSIKVFSITNDSAVTFKIMIDKNEELFGLAHDTEDPSAVCRNLEQLPQNKPPSKNRATNIAAVFNNFQLTLPTKHC